MKNNKQKGTIKKKMKLHLITSVFLFYFLLVFISVGIVFYVVTIKKTEYVQGKNVIYKSNDVLGISTDEVTILVDYSHKIGTGSPLVFGGAHGPKLEHIDAWDKIANSGVTLIRRDFFIEKILPQNITLEDYKNNIGNVQNPEKWNQKEINELKQFYSNARKRNIKVMGIVSYSPKWLTYSNTIYGVPKDWTVYRDIVSKIYRIFRNDVDYLDLWNEPNLNFFLNTKNSNLNAQEAYYQIFLHASSAIRSVDKEINDKKFIPLGAPVSYIPTDTTFLERLLKDKNLSKEIGYVSYHNYEHIKGPSWNKYKEVLKNNNLETIPIFITEWAYSPKMKVKNEFDTGNASIPYTGKILISYLSNNIKGANHSMLQQIVPNSPYGNEGFLGFYYWKNNSAELLPKGKTWTLLSKTLGLGNGDSLIYKVDNSSIPFLAFINASGKMGLAVSNELNTSIIINVKLVGIASNDNLLTDAYVASVNNDGKKIIGTNNIKKENNEFYLKIVVPALSVTGVLLHN